MRQVATILLLLVTTAAVAWNPPDVESSRADQQQRDAEREAGVRSELDRAAQRLRTTRARAGADDSRYRDLQNTYDDLSERIEQRRASLASQRGDVYDIYVAARQAAGDLAAQLQHTATAPPDGDTGATLRRLAGNPRPLSLDELAGLWESLHVALTHSATQSLEPLTVQVAPAELGTSDVLRLGWVTALAGDRAAQFDRLTGLYRVVPAPSPARSDTGRNAVTIRFEPLPGVTAGVPGPAATMRGAGPIGWFIVGLGAAGAALLLLRLILVMRMRRAERRHPADSAGARVAAAQRGHRQEHLESMTGWINTALRREVHRLLWGHAVLNVIIASAPLLGLLGTVTGMIVMFRQLNIYGSGDPVLMAGGIAQALSTTLLGLLVAVPLLLGHRWVCALADDLTHNLDAHAAGLIAAYREQQ